MGELILMKGNEAIAEAAIRAGCRFFAGYPITPQNEVPEYISKRMPEVGGVFVQAESEVAAINMVYGAAGAGARAMTSSSSPGISLKQEGISYIAGADLPAVIINVVRAGPGLGGIQAAQSDYFQATKGGGHGDYRLIVLAPGSVNELANMVMDAFDIADRWRNPVMVLADAVLGQMMEPVDFPEEIVDPGSLPKKPWATVGMKGRSHQNVINSLYLHPEECEASNLDRVARYKKATENETRWEEVQLDDADIVLVAYGTSSRVCRNALDQARDEGIKVGMIRPITLWPYPQEPFDRVAGDVKAFIAVEMSTGQMVEDVKIAVNGRAPVHFHGRTGGVLPKVSDVVKAIRTAAEGSDTE